MNTKYFECDCGYFGHLMRVMPEEFLDDEPAGYMIFTQHMSFYLPWYKRLWLAINYVIGRTIDKCQYTDTLLSKEQCQELIDYLEEFVEE